MAAKKRPPIDPDRRISTNRRAKRDYTIIETVEAGIALRGDEVKSLRNARASIEESHADIDANGVVLHNCHIPPYGHARPDPHYQTRRPRRLLLHRRQIKRMIGAVNRKGYTLIALDMHFNERGLAKVSLALAQGKKQHDRREDIKTRDWQRRRRQLLRQKP